MWVKDGAETLDFLFARGPYASRAGADRPRLLLLDIKMPKVDGFEVLRQIRADERLGMMPVGHHDLLQRGTDIVQAYDLGANSYIAEPADIRRRPVPLCPTRQVR